ncbi:MAG TPA: endonuclease/exonuclease/phosphatase family protein [Nocardioidaceae bacterium]|nr:endonuclease/exonuclease/phosphatase family protein [Nocardioidaceae bacterium]
MKALRVATYNLYLGADLTLVFGARDPAHLLAQARIVHEQLLATDFHARAESVARLVIRERVDVLGLQEVAKWRRAPVDEHGIVGRPKTWCDFLDELLGALDRAGTPYDAHGLNSNFHGGAVVLASESLSVIGYNVILVRRGSGVVVTGTASGTFAAALDIPTEMDDLVFNVQRSWGWIDAAVDGSAFRFVNTHLEAYDAQTRSAQRDQLLSLVGAHCTPVLLVGDFNALPEEVGLPSTYVDAWTGSGGDPRGGHTCGQAADLANKESLLAHRIDYVWVRGARVETCEVVGNGPADRTAAAHLWPSDHACVVAGVLLSPP